MSQDPGVCRGCGSDNACQGECMENKKTLKPCPFCGTQALLTSWWDFGTRYGVRCGFETCRTRSGDPFSQQGSWYRKTEKEAIDAWNQRYLEDLSK